MKPKLIRVAWMMAMAIAAMPLFAQRDPLPGPSQAVLPAGVTPPQLEGVGIDEHLGRPVDLNLTFIAENGYPVALKDFFHAAKPVILNLIYYQCPMLCNLILNGQAQVMREIPWNAGDQYEVVTISIDPSESFNLAREKKSVYLNALNRPASGWHFLCDTQDNAKKLAEQVGYHYRYDEQQGQFAHPAAIFILTPEGRVSRYLYGVRFRAMDVRFALAEASENRTSMTVEKILLYCYHYDPKAGAYVMFASNVMRIGGALTVFIIAFFIWRLFQADRRRTAEWKTKEGMA
ncbi:MAG TPA: SCO family protein [Bryobacteraceae bacterium]|nr:SCO family protein [Bryobacteraceae bacterium]